MTRTGHDELSLEIVVRGEARERLCALARRRQARDPDLFGELAHQVNVAAEAVAHGLGVMEELEALAAARAETLG